MSRAQESLRTTVAEFRPNRRPLLYAVVANLLIAAAFVGTPWVRGRVRFAETRERFARAAACLYGGRPRPGGGLGLPRGELAHHAWLAFHAAPTWPARCVPAFEALVQPPVTVLLPWVKEAEAGVAAAVDLVRRELLRAARERAGPGAGPGPGAEARVSTRPHRAVQQLRSALAVYADAVGLPASDVDAVTFGPEDPALPEPSRVPVGSAIGGALHLVARGDGLVAFALDGRGLGVARVGGGGVETRRITRPRGAHHVVADGEEPVFVWAAPESRCLADARRCADHAVALGRVTPDATVPPRGTWLRGHPWALVERSVAVQGDRAALLARRGDGSPELRTFVWEGPDVPVLARQQPPGEPPTPRDPLAASATRRLAGEGEEVLDAVVLGDGTTATVLRADDGVWLSLDGTAVREALGNAPGSSGEPASPGTSGPAGGPVEAGRDPPAVRLALCRDGERAWALGCAGDRCLLTASPGAAARPPIEAPGPVALACGRQDGVLVLLAGAAADGKAAAAELHRAAGPVGARVTLRAAARTLPSGAVDDDGGAVVAAPTTAAGAVEVVGLGPTGAVRAGPLVPAACWEEGHGLCGPVVVAARSGRALIATREGTDVRVLESTDGGATWRPLSGLD